VPDPLINPRQAVGSLFRSLIDFLYSRGLFEKVRGRVSAATRARMDHPPFLLSWIPSDAIDEIESALLEVAGREVLLELGLYLARNQGRTVVQPLLQMALSMFGQTPAALLSHLDWFFGVTTRGIDFAWEPLGDSAGIVRARFHGAGVPAAAYDVLEGTLRFVPELCKRKGAVERGPLETEDAGTTTAVYRVSWS
jgi:hypothetical protein